MFAVLTYVFQLKTLKFLVLSPSLLFEMITILFEINEIDPGKWFQIVMTGLTLEISFILVSVMTQKKTKGKAASPVQSEAEEATGTYPQ